MERRRGHFLIIRFYTNLIRDEALCIGVVLYEAEGDNPRAAVRMTRDWSWIELLAPGTDIEMLSAMEADLAGRLTSRGAIESTMRRLKEECSNSLQFAEATRSATLFVDFDAELERLVELYVNRPPLPDSLRRPEEPSL